MATIQGYRIIGRFTIESKCGHVTNLKYARTHDGLCKSCAETPRDSRGESIASRDEQHARYIDCGPAAWDDRD
jgi:hypothetical protein